MRKEFCCDKCKGEKQRYDKAKNRKFPFITGAELAFSSLLPALG